jgi:hypothetical protein
LAGAIDRRWTRTSRCRFRLNCPSATTLGCSHRNAVWKVHNRYGVNDAGTVGSIVGPPKTGAVASDQRGRTTMSGLSMSRSGSTGGGVNGVASTASGIRRLSQACDRIQVRRSPGCARSVSHIPRDWRAARSRRGEVAGVGVTGSTQMSRSCTIAWGMPLTSGPLGAARHSCAPWLFVRVPRQTPVAVPT